MTSTLRTILRGVIKPVLAGSLDPVQGVNCPFVQWIHTIYTTHHLVTQCHFRYQTSRDARTVLILREHFQSRGLVLVLFPIDVIK